MPKLKQGQYERGIVLHAVLYSEDGQAACEAYPSWAWKLLDCSSSIVGCSAMQPVALGVSAPFFYGCVWIWVWRWGEHPHYKRHISSMLMHFGELEISFSPIASSTAISYSSVVDCGESYGQMCTIFLDLCVLSWLTSLQQTCWHKVGNGSLTAEGICPSWRYEAFLGWRSCCVLPASILADC